MYEARSLIMCHKSYRYMIYTSLILTYYSQSTLSPYEHQLDIITISTGYNYLLQLDLLQTPLIKYHRSQPKYQQTQLHSFITKSRIKQYTHIYIYVYILAHFLPLALFEYFRFINVHQLIKE